VNQRTGIADGDGALLINPCHGVPSSNRP
jgi:hypothetical protein